MYEIAFVTSRKSKLEEEANKGNLSARLALNKMKKPEEAPAPAGPSQEELLAEIRDLLKK